MSTTNFLALSFLVALGREVEGVRQDKVLIYVAKQFGLTTNDLLGPERTSHIALARRTAVVLLLRLCSVTFADLGRLMGRDRTTIMALRDRAERDIERQPAWGEAIEVMAREIKAAEAELAALPAAKEALR